MAGPDVPATPQKYQGAVASAANQLGIPVGVVAAQIGLESDFDPNAVSPAGAEGIAQFEPGTWATYGHGSPFDPTAAFAAYVAYMRALLKQEGGDLRRALAAYNAGPANLGAGYGYADTVLTRAGVKDITAKPGSSGSSSSGGGGLLDFPHDIIAFFTQATDNVETLTRWITAFFQPSTYVRIGAGVGGLVFLVVGIVCLARVTKGT